MYFIDIQMISYVFVAITSAFLFPSGFSFLQLVKIDVSIAENSVLNEAYSQTFLWNSTYDARFRNVLFCIESLWIPVCMQYNSSNKNCWLVRFIITNSGTEEVGFSSFFLFVSLWSA